MKVHVVFGTESGEGELTAEDIAADLSGRFDIAVTNLSDIDADAIDTDAFYIVVCSTYGEGELPYSAQPFHAALLASRPDLTGLRYAMYGRGDSAYLATYSRGSEIIDELLTDLGAMRVGEYGRHDASDWGVAPDHAIVWANSVLEVRVGGGAP